MQPSSPTAPKNPAHSVAIQAQTTAQPQPQPADAKHANSVPPQIVRGHGPWPNSPPTTALNQRATAQVPTSTTPSTPPTPSPPSPPSPPLPPKPVLPPDLLGIVAAYVKRPARVLPVLSSLNSRPIDQKMLVSVIGLRPEVVAHLPLRLDGGENTELMVAAVNSNPSALRFVYPGHWPTIRNRVMQGRDLNELVEQALSSANPKDSKDSKDQKTISAKHFLQGLVCMHHQPFLEIVSRQLDIVQVALFETGQATHKLLSQAQRALKLLTILSSRHYETSVALWGHMTLEQRAGLITAATTPGQPELAEQALRLLVIFAVGSEVRKVELWAAMSADQRSRIMVAATTLGQPTLADLAMRLLNNFAVGTEARKAQLWAAMPAAERVGVIAAATTLGQSELAVSALHLLAKLTVDSEAIRAELWSAMSADQCLRLIAAATVSGQPALT